MAETSVPITAGSGTAVDAYGLPDGKLQQAMALGDGQNNGRTVAVEVFGALDVFAGYATDFYDTFVGPLDTTDKWTVTGGAPTFTGGQLVMPATASTYNAIRTKDSIRANAGHHLIRNGVQIEATAAVGAGRFWGLGTPATTPAPGVLVQDGIGFEIDQATGNLLAVTYAAGVRTTVATLTRPADGALHAYGVQFRVTQATWYVDNGAVPVLTQAFPNVATPELPALIVRQNAATFTGAPVMNNTAHLTAETSRQGMTLMDPIVGTRQARVSAAGALNVVQTVNTPDVIDRAGRLLGVLSAGTSTIGMVNPDSQASATLGAINAATTIALNGHGTIGIQATGTFTGTLIFEALPADSTTWQNVNVNISNGGTQLSFASIPFWARASGSGYRQFRVRVSAYTSGSATVSLNASYAAYAYPAPDVVIDNQQYADSRNGNHLYGRTFGSGVNTVSKVPLVDGNGALLASPAVPLTVGTALGNVGTAYITGAAVAGTSTAGVSLVAAPAAGLSIYVTDMEGSNEGATGTALALFEGAATAPKYRRFLAASGGGFVTNLRTPWKLPAATALTYFNSAASTYNLTVNYYILP